MIDLSGQPSVEHALPGIFAIAIGTCEWLLLSMHSLMSCAMLTTLEDSSAMSASVRSLHLGASFLRSYCLGPVIARQLVVCRGQFRLLARAQSFGNASASRVTMRSVEAPHRMTGDNGSRSGLAGMTRICDARTSGRIMEHCLRGNQSAPGLLVRVK